MNQWKTVYFSTLVFCSQLAACGNTPQFLRTMDLSITDQNSQNFINLSAEVNLGNAALASLTIPVYDPTNNLEIGQVTFGQAADGNEQITISVDASSLMHGDPTLGQTLPNGLPIPSSLGVPSGTLLAIPILNSSRIYVGGDLKTSVVLGAAFGIPGLDSVMAEIGMAGNIFFSQNFTTDFFGMAGIYASPTTSENGIAVFGRYTIPAIPAPSATPAAAELKMANFRSAEKIQVANTSVPLISVKGVMPKSGNLSESQNMNQNSGKKLYNYFYGKKNILRPR